MKAPRLKREPSGEPLPNPIPAGWWLEPVYAWMPWFVSACVGHLLTPLEQAQRERRLREAAEARGVGKGWARNTMQMPGTPKIDAPDWIGPRSKE